MQRAQTDFGNASMDPLEKFPGSGRTQTAEKFKIDLWLGKPPKWVGLFRISNSLVLNVVADMYAKSGKSCNLSSVLQSLFSCYPPNFDLTSEGRDEALSSLCELIVQYIDLKIESDIEELYICFRLLKRYFVFIVALLLTIHFYFIFYGSLAHIPNPHFASLASLETYFTISGTSLYIICFPVET